MKRTAAVIEMAFGLALIGLAVFCGAVAMHQTPGRDGQVSGPGLLLGLAAFGLVGIGGFMFCVGTDHLREAD